MNHVHVNVPSPIGDLTLVASNGLLCGLYMIDQRHRPSSETFGDYDPSPFAKASEQLQEYFAGERTTFDLQLAAVGSSFERSVWAALCDIPYGETASYGEIAKRVGRPGAARAVGLANGANPIGIIVPCHRVIGSTGNLVGYGGGIERKQYLLDLEKRRAIPELFA